MQNPQAARKHSFPEHPRNTQVGLVRPRRWGFSTDRRHLKSVPWYANSAESMVSHCKGITFAPAADPRVATLEIEDFLMSGDIWEIAKHACDIFVDPKLRSLGLSVVEGLLGARHIRSEILPEHLWAVVRGSGMGMRLSSSIANAAFYCLAERPLISQASLLSAGMSWYVRDKGDFLVALD